MLFNKKQKEILIAWGCERRDLTITRLAWAAAYMVNPAYKHEICLVRDDLILNWDDGTYTLVYLNTIKPGQGLGRRGRARTPEPA